jgi:hypothetical protein
MGRKKPTGDILGLLRDYGSRYLCVEIAYKKTGESWTTTRIVEPYSITFTQSEALIVLTRQIEPYVGHPGWRNFRLDRIVSVKNTSRHFKPFIPVTILDCPEPFVYNETPDAQPSEPSYSEKYFFQLEAALQDGNLTKHEFECMKILQGPLLASEVKALHAQLYANTIDDIVADGKLTQAEEDYLQNVRVFLGQLGWCP